jgi:mannitol-specific phosphotransferase system IIBC component
MKRNLPAKWIVPICIAAPVASWLLWYNSERWFGGYQIGFELLILNGLLTFLGLLAISKTAEEDVRANLKSL